MENTTESPAGFDQALKIFHEAAERVPAYGDFLRKHNIDHAQIQNYAEWQRVPITNKENYFRAYPFKDLAWDGRLDAAQIISMSSGSSGQPFTWPRGEEAMQEAAEILDDLYAKVYGTKEKTTLCIISYAMGTWLAGTYMISALYELKKRGHKLVVVTPGINKAEIIDILQRLAQDFDQTLLMGYSPLLKDVVDMAVEAQVPLDQYNIKFMFSSEHITEQWRRYVLDRVSPHYDPRQSLSLYGAAEYGIGGMETPLIVHLRQYISRDEALATRLFPDTKVLPTLVYYEPHLRYIEEVDSHFIFTLRNVFPLIRYDLNDEGRLVSQKSLVDAVREAGYEVPLSLVEQFPDRPIIALYGRQDVAAIFYGVNIYPENLQSALDDTLLQQIVTGKFTVAIEHDEQQEQTLQIHVELKNGTEPLPDIEKQVYRSLVETLKRVNSEYHKLAQEIGASANPHVTLVANGGPEFEIGRKHRWVVKP
jgi:phenylacetate-CoA ligase